MTPSGRSSVRRRSPSDEEAGEIPEHDPAPGIGARHSSTRANSGSCLSSYASLANLEPPSTIFRSSTNGSASNIKSDSNVPPSIASDQATQPISRGGGARSSFRGGRGGHEGRGRIVNDSSSYSSNDYGGKREGRGGRGGGRYQHSRGGARIGGGRSPPGGPPSNPSTRRLSLSSTDQGQDPAPSRSIVGDRFSPLSLSVKEDSQGNYVDFGAQGTVGGGRGGRFWRGGEPHPRFEKRRNSFDSNKGTSERGTVEEGGSREQESYYGGSNSARGGGRESYRGAGRESYRGGGRFSRCSGRGRTGEKGYATSDGSRSSFDGNNESTYGPTARSESGGGPRELSSRGGGRGRGRGRFNIYDPPVEVTRTSSLTVVSDYTSIIAADLQREKEVSKLSGLSEASFIGAKRPRDSFCDGDVSFASIDGAPSKKSIENRSSQNFPESYRQMSSPDNIQDSREQPDVGQLDGEGRNAQPLGQLPLRNDAWKTTRHHSEGPLVADGFDSKQNQLYGVIKSNFNDPTEARSSFEPRNDMPESRHYGDVRLRFEPRQSPQNQGSNPRVESEHDGGKTTRSVVVERSLPSSFEKRPPEPPLPHTSAMGLDDSTATTAQPPKSAPYFHYGPADAEMSAPPPPIPAPSIAGRELQDAPLPMPEDMGNRTRTRWGTSPQLSYVDLSEPTRRNVREAQASYSDPLSFSTKDPKEPFPETGGQPEETHRSSSRYFGRNITCGRGHNGGRGASEEDGERHSNDWRASGFTREGWGRGNMHGYAGRGDTSAGGRGVGSRESFSGDMFGGRGDGFVPREGGRGGRVPTLGGFGAGRVYGRSGGRGRSDFTRGAVQGTSDAGRSSGRYGDMAFSRSHSSFNEDERRAMDDPNSMYTGSRQFSPPVTVSIHNRDSNQSVVTDYSSIATAPPPMIIKEMARRVKKESDVSNETTATSGPPPPQVRTETPPPEPSAPSSVVLALTRLADMEAEMEFAFAKHVLLKAKQRNLRAQFKLLEMLPIGIEAVQDDLDALPARAEGIKEGGT